MARDYGMGVSEETSRNILGDHPVVHLAVTVTGGATVAAGTVLAKNSDGKHLPLALEQTVSGEVLASGDGSAKQFDGALANGGVQPGTVTIGATVGGSGVQMSDDGRGRLYAEGVGKGFVDYDSGRYWVIFDTAPDNGTDITAGYHHDDGGLARAASVLLEDIDASAGDEPGTAVAHAVLVSDDLIWPDGISDAQKSRALEQLASAGIHVR